MSPLSWSSLFERCYRARAAVGTNPTDAAATPQPGVLITVGDSGPGVAPEIQRQLFQPCRLIFCFYREHVVVA